MKSTVMFAVLLSLTLNSVVRNSCGGLLEGEQGRFSITNASNQEQPEIASSSCLWILQLHYENGIRFTLDALGEDAVLNLYPEDQLPSCGFSIYTTLNSTQVGSSFEFPGKTLIVVLPNSLAAVAFSWHFIDNESKNTIMKNSDYIDSSNGLVEWGQLKTVERVTWGINANANFHIKWDVDVAASCNASDHCDCFYFGIFQLTSEGVLREAVKTCGVSSEGKHFGKSERVLVVVKANTKVGANKVAVTWGLDDAVVTEPPVTEPPGPVPIRNGIFAGTTSGLVALNLQTLETTSLTNGEEAIAVAVNHNLEKVYWSEIKVNCRIMRSNLNGSATEIVVPPTGGTIYALAVHEPSGNIYFSVRYSNEITVCNAVGENCSVVVSNSSLANGVYSIVLDHEIDVMYWSNYESGQSSLFRGNLDGSSVTTISSGFSTSRIVVITLVQHSKDKDTLYWADQTRNTIGTIDTNGSNKQTLVKLDDNPGPVGIQADARHVYFGNWNAKAIQSVDRVSGEGLATILSSTAGFYYLALFTAPA